MAPRIALITGTSSGMGLHAAVGLAAAGVTVVATMRDTGKAGALREAARAAGVEVEVRALDVTDAEGCARCVAEVAADHGGIDILVNNAGQGMVATLEQLDDDALRAQVEVGYIGPARLTRAVLPIMRAAGGGRVVTVTSVGGVVGQPFADAYCGAKFAVEGLMQSLAPVAARFGIAISLVEPAAVASEFVGNVARPGAPGAYAPMLEAYLARSARAFAAAQPADEAAAIIVEAATTASPRLRWQTSESAAALVGLSLLDTDGSRVVAQTSTWLT